ncbi:MAG TPA: hypothetical protein VN108_00315, partial [Marmoricola sp.]|nr:hypothetical protein [Marmoricola sp.]
STFGSSPAKDVMGVWTSLGVCAVFALVIYYWAIVVALPKDVIMHMINEVVVPEAEEVESVGTRVPSGS